MPRTTITATATTSAPMTDISRIGYNVAMMINSFPNHSSSVTAATITAMTFITIMTVTAATAAGAARTTTAT